MTGRLEAARLWWSARTRREQVLLAVMAAALFGVFGWYGVATPLAAASETARTRLAKASLQWATLQDLAAGASRAGAPSRGAPQAMVEAAASKVGLPIARHRQDANGRFTIWIAAIDSKSLLPWIANLEHEGGVRVTDFTASRLDNGLLEAEITFARTGP
jgi:general secretion pathway protein M